MPLQQTLGWLGAWRRRASAWGALLGEEHILLASLAVQSTGSVRVAVFEQEQAPAGLGAHGARDHWLVQRLRAASARLPRRERALALALHAGRCRQGEYLAAAGLNPSQLAAEVQLEAASALGVAPAEVGFDFALLPGSPAAVQPVQWAACTHQDLQHWQDHARRAGWRLPVVEPEHQAARRAASCLRGDAQLLWAQSPQDWQFERRPVRRLDDAIWQAVQTLPQWGPLVACGAALGLMA